MKIIISCSVCQKKMRIPTNKHIKFNCVQCNSLITADNGKVISTLKGIKQSSNYKNRSQKQKGSFDNNSSSLKLPKISTTSWTMIIGAFIAIVSAVLFISNLQEKRAFAEVKKSPNIIDLEQFLVDFSRSDYTTDVIYLRDSILYHNLVDYQTEEYHNDKFYCTELENLLNNKITYKRKELNTLFEDCLLNQAAISNTFTALENYRLKFSSGQYLDSISKIEDQLWQQLKIQYADKNHTKNISNRAKKFITELLNYAQDTKQKEIRLIFNSSLSLKDWEDYPIETHTAIDTMYSLYNKMEGTNYPLPSVSPPPSIKRTLRDNKSKFQRTIVSTLQAKFDSIFNPNPFKIIAVLNLKQMSNKPGISIDYKIETLVDELAGEEYPSLYIKTEGFDYGNFSKNNSRNNVDELYEEATGELNKRRANVNSRNFKGYLLATNISWSMTFKIPDVAADYTFQTSSRPQNSFSGIKNERHAYSLMLESAFRNYALKIAEGIGL